ncbi:MAG: hypothetical protein GF317_11125 [Candidatus Lokiarchaeota archaeon]|nr:hypothetical protein [Candidatus Lokiarchaeota archaeon]
MTDNRLYFITLSQKKVRDLFNHTEYGNIQSLGNVKIHERSVSSYNRT